MFPQFDKLLYRLYACAHEPGAWGGALDDLASALDVQAVALQWCEISDRRLRPTRSVVNSHASGIHERYEAHISDTGNPRMDSGRVDQLLDRAVFDHDILPDTGSLTRFDHKMEEIGLGRFAGCASALGDGRYLTLALHQGRHQTGMYSAEQIGSIEALTRHLCQISRLEARLSTTAAARQDMAGVMDSMRSGMILCDDRGVVSWSNQPARRLLAQPEAALYLHGGVLRCSREPDRKILGLALAQQGQRYLSLGRTSELQLCVQSLPSNTFTSMPADRRIIALSKAREPQELPPAAIASLFQLTPAEARLTSALCNGKSLDGYAHERGISVGTVRVQAKQILAKTQTGRQADLVRLVLSSVLSSAGNRLH